MEVVLFLLRLTRVLPIPGNQGTERLKLQLKGSAGPLHARLMFLQLQGVVSSQLVPPRTAEMALRAKPAALASPPARGSGATEVNLLLQSLFPHAGALMHSCTFHSPGNISVLFNQPCLQGSAVLEHQSNMHIQQRVCPAVQSFWLPVRAGKPELQRCSGHDTVSPASFPCLLSVRLEMPFPVCVTDMP